MPKNIMCGHIGQFWWRKHVAIVSEVSDSDTRERDNIPRHSPLILDNYYMYYVVSTTSTNLRDSSQHRQDGLASVGTCEHRPRPVRE